MPTNSTRRPVGRPRADGRPPLERREVLLTAGRLITEHGYAATSLRMIAEALGTSAPAVLQRFGNKAELLNELVSMMADVSIRFHNALQDMDLAPDVRLFKMIHAEVVALAGAQDAPISLFYLPELRQPDFSAARQARADMIRFYHEVIEQGIELDIFHDESVTTTAEQIFQLTETIIVTMDKSALGTPAQLANHTASFALRAILRKPAQIAKIQTAAEKISIAMS